MFAFLSATIVFVVMMLMLLSGTASTGQAEMGGKRGRVRSASRSGAMSGYSLKMRRAWHAQPMRSSGWSYLIVPGLYKFFEVGKMLRPSILSNMFNVQTSAESKEENVGIGGISDEAWDNYKNSGVKSAVSFDQGYKVTYNHEEYVVQLRVERKLMDDDQYGVLNTRARRLGISAMQKMERDGASVFNNAFSASYLGADAKALCATDHPNSPSNASTQGNKGTSALTKANVGAIRQLMMAYKDDAGNLLGITPDTLIVPPALEDTALEIANSVYDPTSANNAINPQAGRFRVQAWHFLTDTNNWFMADSVWQREALNWYNRVLPNGLPEITLVDESSTEAVYDVYMRYSFGWDDWRWVYGNEVA